MFYTDNKIMTYPSKSIIEDVLTRDGSPNKESFTPYSGMNHMIGEQFKNAAVCVTVDKIIAVSADFDPHLKRATDDDARNRDVAAYEVDDYYTRLEDIDEGYVRSYVLNILIGFKLNNNGIRRLIYNSAAAETTIEDEEGEFEEVFDVYPEIDENTSVELVELQSEIPHLLRLLHRGSIEMGVSLLSLVIAHESWKKSVSYNTNVSPTPRDIYEREVYTVDSRGALKERLTAQINTTQKFSIWKQWIWGEMPDDRYYKAYRRLAYVAARINIDLASEDVKEYTPEVMENALSTFIEAKGIIVDQYWLVDPKILDLLSVEKLFIVQKSKSEESASSEMLIKDYIQYLSLNINSVFEKYSDFKERRPAAVQKFLSFKYKCDSSGIVKYSERNGIVCDATSMTPCIFEIRKVTSLIEDRVNAILTISGNIVLLEQDRYYIRYTPVENILSAYANNTKVNDWRYARL